MCRTRLQVGGGTADHLEHFARRGLLLEGFGKIVGSLAQFVEQPRVLDGDDGLRGEVLHQIDLLVGERPHLLPIHGNCTDEFTILEHRDRQMGPGTPDFDQGDDAVIFPDVRLVNPEVRNVNNLFGLEDPVEWVSRIFAYVSCGVAPPRIDVSSLAVDRDRAKDKSFAQEQIAERGLADAGCVREHRIEDWCQLAGRTR